jgi:GTPase SAR1 family protein
MIAVVGNKKDLEHRRVVTSEDGQRLANGAPYFETSAKTNDGVDAVFEGICEFVIMKKLSVKPMRYSSKSLKDTVTVADDTGEEGCC